MKRIEETLKLLHSMVLSGERTDGTATKMFKESLKQLEELKAAASKAATWMQWWLDQNECECDGLPHTCGKLERQRELDELKKLLDSSEE
jgi:hypothetical protein